MFYDIVPNNRLGFGVILKISTHSHYLYQIPCHNRATAEDLIRAHKRRDFAYVEAAASWAKNHDTERALNRR